MRRTFLVASSNKRVSDALSSDGFSEESMFMLFLVKHHQPLTQFRLALLQRGVLGGVLVMRVEREAAADDPVARRGRAVAERAADALRLQAAPGEHVGREIPIAQHEPA